MSTSFVLLLPSGCFACVLHLTSVPPSQVLRAIQEVPRDEGRRQEEGWQARRQALQGQEARLQMNLPSHLWCMIPIFRTALRQRGMQADGHTPFGFADGGCWARVVWWPEDEVSVLAKREGIEPARRPHLG
jgi:hypothetical protein